MGVSTRTHALELHFQADALVQIKDFSAFHIQGHRLVVSTCSLFMVSSKFTWEPLT
jgi:hypothetical protein